MKNKINIAKLLKNCPRDMELDCTMYENVYFDYVDTIGGINCYIKSNDGCLTRVRFLENGCYTTISNAKCVIFPKDKTTWEGFIPPCKFEDGDVVATKNGLFIGIVKIENGVQQSAYVAIYGINNLSINISFRFERFATFEEKEKLFQAIKDKGYKWNEETKTLEKLPKFKIEKGKWYVCTKDLLDNYANKAFCEDNTYLSTQDGSLIPSNSNVPFEVVCASTYFRDWTIQDAKDGDVIFYDDGWTCIFKCIHGIWYSSYCFITSDGEFHTSYEEHAVDSTINGNAHLATKEQRDFLFQKIKEAGYKWNLETKTLEKLPKFKVGDKIRHKNDNTIRTISYIYHDSYGLYDCHRILFEDQDEYELVTDIKPKFKVAVTNEIGKSIDIKEQDNYELVPNKFDITTLKPFESKVLVRDLDHQYWRVSFFGFFKKDECVYDTVRGIYKQCIPYEGNEHLLGKTYDCDDFFKTW